MWDALEQRRCENLAHQRVGLRPVCGDRPLAPAREQPECPRAAGLVGPLFVTGLEG